MDIWRIRATGGEPERITSHNSRVGYPVLLDDRTLVYTATSDDGTGPWLYSMDLRDRIPTRLSPGVEHFLSIAASAEIPGQPRRLVATVSNPSVQLWSVPLADGISGEESAPASSRCPRHDPPRHGSPPTHRCSIWRRAAEPMRYGASRLPAPVSCGTRPRARRPTRPASRRTGEASASPYGDRAVRRCGARIADGSGVRTLADSLDVRGAPSWSPDGKWIAVAAKDGEAIRVFKVAAGRGAAGSSRRLGVLESSLVSRRQVHTLLRNAARPKRSGEGRYAGWSAVCDSHPRSCSSIGWATAIDSCRAGKGSW